MRVPPHRPKLPPRGFTASAHEGNVDMQEGHGVPNNQPLRIARRRHGCRTLTLRIASGAVIGTLAASCVSPPGNQTSVAVSPAAPAAFSRERLIGNWGIASFHTEKDRKRTEGEAR